MLACNANASEKCIAIASDSERLACYDMEYRPSPVVAKVSKWDVSESSSKMDDSKTVSLHLESNEPIQRRFGGSESADIYIRCQEKSTSMYFIYAGNFLSSIQGYGEVTYRVDDQKPVTREFEESTDNKALGLWNGGTAIPFIKRLFGKNLLTVRITPFNESPVTTQFQISGLEEAIKPLRAACGW
ncbi:hypothetical protein PcP3B5_46530 [Pseudomonas citronellolis]|nr:hypothetical protein PcP3B5_46530 [Pseudomonas citronellolis]